jgi:RHS repeat-associated protein
MRWIYFAFIFFQTVGFAEFSVQCDDKDRVIVLNLDTLGSVHYFYDGSNHIEIIRLNNQGEVLYRYGYFYDENRVLQTEILCGNLGEKTVSWDAKNDVFSSTSPYLSETCYFDSKHLLKKHVIDSTTREYEYNEKEELLFFNPPQIGTYDENGDLTGLGDFSYTFDENHQLIQAKSSNSCINFCYKNGVRISKTVESEKGNYTEYYMSLGGNPILTFTDDGLKELRIPGFTYCPGVITPIAIETADNIYLPLYDYLGNIIKLISTVDDEMISLPLPHPYGEHLNQDTPTAWSFAGKHYDKETGLVYFGARYYAPLLHKWISPDPLGNIQSDDLYQYCFHNPLKYIDPDGKFAAVLLIPVIGSGIGFVKGAAIAIGAWLGCEATRKGNELIQDYKREQEWKEEQRQERQRRERIIEQTRRKEFESRNYDFDSEMSQGIFKSGSVDPSLPANPDDLLKRPGWKETTHPDAGKSGHRRFENEKTGEKLRHDKGKPGMNGHKEESHWHRFNPDSKNRFDEYLDADNIPVPRNSPESHLYPKK